MGYLIPKKNSSGTIKPITGGIRLFHIFPKGISAKVNVIAWLEFELTYYNVTVQHVNHYTTETPCASS